MDGIVVVICEIGEMNINESMSGFTVRNMRENKIYMKKRTKNFLI